MSMQNREKIEEIIRSNGLDPDTVLLTEDGHETSVYSIVEGHLLLALEQIDDLESR